MTTRPSAEQYPPTGLSDQADTSVPGRLHYDLAHAEKIASGRAIRC